MIYKLGNKLILSLDVNEILDIIVTSVPKFLNACGCVVRIVDDERANLKLEAAYGVSGGFKDSVYLLPIGDGISGQVAISRAPIAISDISKDNRFKYHKECLRGEIKRNYRSQFDPRLARAFISILKESGMAIVSKGCSLPISLAS
ncbi:MAG: GAF domain-containing protein [Candidatus Omnitrophica bacterium]|nr:GAF domain-containing protein [Candidatus Omnitrophota bacterium]